MNLRKLLFCLTAVLLTVASTSCDSGEDFIPDAEKPFELELTIKTNASYRGVGLELSGPEFTIDWGDGSALESFKADGGYSPTEKEHQYPESSSIDEYTVKITGKGVNSFTINPDPENKDVLASIVKSVDFKNCPTLRSVSLLGVDDMKSIDFNQLPALDQLLLTATFFTTLDCSAKEDLRGVFLYNNQLLASVKFPANINTITLSDNPLLTEEKVNLPNYTNLEFLYLEYMDWESVYLGSNKSLLDLTILDSELKDIDLGSNKELTYLRIRNCDFTEVDLSVHNKMERLSITYSDVSNVIVPANGFPSLNYTEMGDNKLAADKLDALFNALPDRTASTDTHSISIHNNPGVAGCNTDIAKNKGWKVFGK